LVHHERVRYLLIVEAANLARVSPATVRYWIAKKRLRSVRPGRRRMVREDDLMVFLEANASVARRPSAGRVQP